MMKIRKFATDYSLSLNDPLSLFLYIPIFIAIYASYIISQNPVDLVINDEIFLLIDIALNDFTLDSNELWKNKAGTKWPLYKFLFALSANGGWHHYLFLASGFFSIITLFFTVFIILKMEKLKFEYSIAFLISIFLLARPNSYYSFFHSLLSERFAELILSLVFFIIAIYLFHKQRYNWFIVVAIIGSLFTVITGNPFGMPIIFAVIPTLLFCYHWREALLHKLVFVILTYLIFKIYIYGIPLIENQNIFAFFNLWKNTSWLIYFFINPFSDFLSLLDNKEQYLHRLIAGLAFFIPAASYTIINRKDNFLITLSFFSLSAFVFAAGVLYVGESVHIARCDNLECLSSKMSHRFVLAPFGTMFISFLLFHFALRHSSKSKNVIKFLILILFSYIILVSTISDFDNFKKGIERRSVGSSNFHLGKNPEDPCWRRIGFWRPMDDEVCNLLVNTYMEMKLNKKNITFDIF